jgi:hypothetical protein
LSIGQLTVVVGGDVQAGTLTLRLTTQPSYHAGDSIDYPPLAAVTRPK